jgi:hypothetical protein
MKKIEFQSDLLIERRRYRNEGRTRSEIIERNFHSFDVEKRQGTEKVRWRNAIYMMHTDVIL